MFFQDSRVHWDFNSQSGSPLENVWVHSLTPSYTPGNMKCDSRASLLAYTFANLALVANPRSWSQHLSYDFKELFRLCTWICVSNTWTTLYTTYTHTPHIVGNQFSIVVQPITSKNKRHVQQQVIAPIPTTIHVNINLPMGRCKLWWVIILTFLYNFPRYLLFKCIYIFIYLGIHKLVLDYGLRT